MRASQHDLLQALRRLTESDKVDIWRMATKQLGGTRFSSGADLFHDTVDALLRGDRHWPVHVPFIQFLRLAMKSVAGDDRDRHENARMLGSPIEDMLDAGSPEAMRTPSALDDVLRRERFQMAEETLLRAREALSGDRVAVDVISGWMATMTPEEIRATYNMASASYDAGRKRALRTIHLLLAKAH